MPPYNLYERYCQLSLQSDSKPVWFEDAFLEGSLPAGGISGNTSQLYQIRSARTTQQSVQFHGAGTLTIILGFAAKLSNVTINVQAGDLVLFVGPYSNISNFSIQSYDKDCWPCFGAGNTANTGSILIQGQSSSIFFGHDCMFSTNFHARTSDSHSLFSYETGFRINQDACIKLGDHTWIGRSVILNKGVCSEDDVIFGQGSIVSGKAHSASIYAGVPAKKIKSNVTWDRARTNSISEITTTYHYRPQQRAINDFLTKDIPFHPNAKRILSDLRQAYTIQKSYPWIPEVMSSE